MPPPYLKNPEWFLRHVVDKRIMDELLDRVVKFYDDYFMEVVYRAHHISIKVEFADIFYNDFVRYIVRVCGLKKMFWKYLPESSAIRYMYEERRKFFNYLKKLSEKRRYHMVGDIRWSFKFWLSQLSFWYGTVKSFTNVYAMVALDNESIGQEVYWDEAIVLYIISDFLWSARESGFKCVKKKWREKYMKYSEMEKW